MNVLYSAAAALMLAVLPRATQAQNANQNATAGAGLATGAVAGAIIGGPVGAVVGGAIGASPEAFLLLLKSRGSRNMRRARVRRRRAFADPWWSASLYPVASASTQSPPAPAFERAIATLSSTSSWSS